MTDDSWTPEKQRAADDERRGRFLAENIAIAAANAIADAERHSSDPVLMARFLRGRLQTLGDWDLVEDLLLALLRQIAAKEVSNMNGHNF